MKQFKYGKKYRKIKHLITGNNSKFLLQGDPKQDFQIGYQKYYLNRREYFLILHR